MPLPMPHRRGMRIATLHDPKLHQEGRGREGGIRRRTCNRVYFWPSVRLEPDLLRESLDQGLDLFLEESSRRGREREKEQGEREPNDPLELLRQRTAFLQHSPGAHTVLPDDTQHLGSTIA